MVLIQVSQIPDPAVTITDFYFVRVAGDGPLQFFSYGGIIWFLVAVFEPRHEISNNVVCVTSEGSDKPANTHSLIRAFASGLNIL